MESQVNNKRIAKNTLLLYFRTMLTMVISLYTSRVVLQKLGIDDYGIYNVVGGFVAMFSIISGALTSSISRFLTFELGRNQKELLAKIFTTSVLIQATLALLIIFCGEILGIWYLNCKMNMPEGRLYAANWVLQCSFITFALNILSVPFNSAIVAHERMSAFAYVSILEVSLKLLIAYLIGLTRIDNLIVYACLMAIAALIIQSVYAIYCFNHFEECKKYKFVFDKQLVKEMTGFAGWTFFTNGSMLFNTQGVNLLINNFFGVTVNAARGIAGQMESAIIRFTTDFTTAINPQITKSYAAGDTFSMYKLVCRGAKFSFFLFLCIALPLLFETQTILKIWLNIVPEHTVWMFRLSVCGTMLTILGNTGYTACMATGNIRTYALVITTIGCLVFPITWIVYYLGAPVEATYIVYIFVYLVIDFVRLWIMKSLTGFPPSMFLKDVFGKIILVMPFAMILPAIVVSVMEEGIIRLMVTIIVSELSSLLSIYYLGIEKEERNYISRTIINKISSKRS